jgi:enterochelin esterase family protein
LETGRSHSFHYDIDGRRKGGATDVPAYLPECYLKSDVPEGTLSEKLVHTSKIYEGMTSDYWIYVPAKYDPNNPAALMVWQDGADHVDRNGKAKTLNVMDNLIHQGKIPVMISVFVSPGRVGERSMRSYEYDRVDDSYARFLRDELLPEVDKLYNIRKDGYSRAIAGVSSGGICSFNVAWHQPDQFSRVLSLIGSYTSIAWQHGDKVGGYLYPFKVRKEQVRNIRVWLQDGSMDIENEHGSWPLQNIQLANSLKFKGYDFHFSWGKGSHDAAHGWAELPLSLEWLWRGYDPSNTDEVFHGDPDESKKPMFRAIQLNR